MSKKHIGIIAIISVIFVCTASIGYIAYSGVWRDWVAGEWYNSYKFSISFGTIEDLYNVTLYLPILMVKGEISSLMYEMNCPSNWTWNIIETEHGKMLKISADFIPAGGIQVNANTEPNHTINTHNPVGNEPILYPRYNETPTEHVIEISARYEYQSVLYMHYNTSTNGELTIKIWMQGSKYRTYSLPYPGSEGGRYNDIIKYKTNGENAGWRKVDGSLEIGGTV